jgi:hypothetical protein
MTHTAHQATVQWAAGEQYPLLPASLLLCPVQHLTIDEPLAASLRAHGVATVGDLLTLPDPVFEPGAWLGPTGRDDLRAALARLLHAGLGRLEPPASDDWPALQGQLLAALGPEDRDVLRELIGFAGHPTSLPEIARRTGLDLRTIEERADSIRLQLHERAPSLLCRLRHEAGRELQSFLGLTDGQQAAQGSLLQTMARGTGDPAAPLRLCAFCFPHDFHVHDSRLVALSGRRFRQLDRQIRRLVPPHRLPLPIDTLLAELAATRTEAPRGVVRHLLRTTLHAGIELDPERGEIAVPDPRSPAARLQDLLAECGQPTSLDELVYAYRERFHRARRTAIEAHLRTDPAFVLLGPDTWSLRSWHLEELAAVAPLVDKAARRLCSEGGKRTVASLLAADATDDRTRWLVADRLAVDPRVRALGRGELCPATHTRSQVLDQLLVDFRRAAGDVVTSLFVQNQPPERRRLVQRLLQWNRLFVVPCDDRIDVLTNYPFNEERLQRLVQLVGQHLDRRSGYAQVTALKALLDRTDLGGGWLSPTLLADLLRRHGPFEVLPGGVVSRRELGLGSSLMRSVRQALRAADEPVTVDEILRARPDLVEFAACLRELLAADPLVQTPDGCRFTLV